MATPDLPTPTDPGAAASPASAAVPPAEAGAPDRLPVAPDIGEEEWLLDNIVPTRGYKMLPLVGLGGSAGSIVPLQEFFRAMPADTGMVFAVVLHLSPEHESALAEILGRCTAMPVVQAEDGQKVHANHVYVIPPGRQLTSVDGQFRLSELLPLRGKRVTVDLFFRTVADTHGPHAAAIVLSGGDGDGALGIKRIKERGGLTIAQDPTEAEHDSMPRSAISTGMVDWVLPVSQMPARLIAYHALEQHLELPAEEGPPPAESTREPAPGNEPVLREILAFLHTQTGHDFSYYKRATIIRRIGRRLQVNGLADLPSYLLFLRTHQGEPGALLQDLLISVTNFFRDRDAFEALEARVPSLFVGKGPTDTVRVWVPACATGEEAFSIAILLAEHARTLEHPPKMQIFATDLDEAVVTHAREARYPMASTADLSEERLRQFFVKEAHGFRVRSEIREMVLFALHDLLRDSPFSRLDLVSCRNLLIYLTREAQTRVLEIFHFALRTPGLLFLGTSETVEENSPLFGFVSKKHRLLERRASPRATLPVPVGASALSRSLEVQAQEKKSPLARSRHFFPEGEVPGELARSLDLSPASGTWPEVHFKLLERLAAPSLIVNEQYEILHLSEHAARYVQFTGGEPTRNLLRVVHPALRLELRAGLFRALQSRSVVRLPRVPFEVEGQPAAVEIRIAPAGECLLVIFERGAESDLEPEGSERTPPGPVEEHLELELEHTKSALRQTVENYETAIEEQKASNEELQAMNEELRSATEELETSREELQSINEELTTVNAELKTNVDELAHANSDLQNLMASTLIATVFVDREQRIMRYTPSAVALFHLIPGDVGRPLADLQQRLEYPELAEDAARVLDRLIPVERAITDAQQRWYLARLLPYRSADDHIGGVVLNFVEITERRRAEQNTEYLARVTHELADLGTTEEIMSSAGEGLGAFLGLSACAFAKIDESAQEAVISYDWHSADSASVRGTYHLPDFLSAEFQRASRAGEVFVIEDTANDPRTDAERYAALGVRSFVSVPIVRDGKWQFLLVLYDARPRVWRADEVNVAQEFAARVWTRLARAEAEAALASTAAKLERQTRIFDTTLSSIADFAYTFDRAGRFLYANRALAELLQLSTAEIAGKNFHELPYPAELAEQLQQQIERVFTSGEPLIDETPFLTPAGEQRWYEYIFRPVFAADGKTVDIVAGSTRDITERRRRASAAQLSERQLRMVMNSAQDYAIIALDLKRCVTIWSTGAERILGYSEEEIIGHTLDVIFLEEDRASGRPEKEMIGALTEGRAIDERWHLRRDGSRFWASGELMAMRDEDGTAIGLVKIFRNQTEAREAQSRLEKSESDLREAVEAMKQAREIAEAARHAKDHFLAVLSHELRTPLTPVLMAVHTLARTKDLSPTVAEGLQMIRRNVEIEARFIDDLLDVTRIERGKLELQFDELDLHEVVTRAAEISASDFAAKNQPLILQLDATAHRLVGDTLRLQQVFWNLLKNASKFSAPGGRIQLRTWNEPGRILIAVTDSGIGFSAETQEQIFEPFSQAGVEVTRKFGGLGLGLAIAKATVDGHDGRLSASSEGAKKGATFTVDLPLARPTAASAIEQQP